MKRFAGLVFLKHWIRLSSLFIFSIASSQDIAVGTWRTHFSYLNTRILEVTEDKLFCASDNGLFSVELENGTTRKLSKIDGLSDVGVSSMAFSPTDNVLVIGYESGLVDFVFENEIIGVTDIANSNLEGDKAINDIVFGQDRTYLATDLGVIILNTNTAEIVENYIQIGPEGNTVEVLELILRNDSLFILADVGIQSGNLNQNLLDFNNWNRYLGTELYSFLTEVDGSVYALNGSDLMVLESNTWQNSSVSLPPNSIGIIESDDELFAPTSDGELFVLNELAFELALVTTLESINDLEQINGVFYLADGAFGLVDSQGNTLSPSGPYSDTYSNIRVLNNELYAFHAPSPFSYDGGQKIDNYGRFSEGNWTLQSINSFQNISDVGIFNGSRYFTSIGSGLYDESADQIIKNIPISDSSLDTILTSIGTGNQMWIGGFSSFEPVHILDEQGNWRSLSSSQVFEEEVLSTKLSVLGIAWLGTSSGITVVDLEENLFNLITTANGLPSPTYTDIELSIEDNAWVGTLRGPATFSDASFIFTNTEAILPTFENRVLFEGEEINAVITDGGNRVWFGTNRGLWVFDENTSEQVAVFNEANSPLPSDRILDLAYDGISGEVYIVTEKGMVSYRSASSIGNRAHRNVTIFPNPIHPSYQGQVGITGLARNANLKITDINGNLVKELDANGGSASWDLLDLRGGEVVSGIYFFFSSTSDGEETFVGKIAVIR